MQRDRESRIERRDGDFRIERRVVPDRSPSTTRQVRSGVPCRRALAVAQQAPQRDATREDERGATRGGGRVPARSRADARHAAFEALRSNGFLFVGREESAYETFWGWQKPAVAIVAIVLVVALVVAPATTLLMANVAVTLLYLGIIAFRFYTIHRAELTSAAEIDISPGDVKSLAASELPVYTILSPLYREPETVVQFLRAMRNLDYPFERLDIRVLLEEDDRETYQSATAEIARMGYPESITLVVVPEAHPKTKPKACNHGLNGARGDYVVIYDAEDLPEPDQLRKALIAFQRLPPDTVCVQAKLNYFNPEQNLLTRFFTAEYSTWFDLFLPGLFAVGAPVPLGGTSNHFKAEALRALGAWDPFNVTEDADLGMRIARAGYRTAVIDSTTWEEANSRVGNWIRQRSRWIKGYMQTWLVTMRHPVQLLRALGLWRFVCFQATIGGTAFVLLVNPIYWLATAVYVLMPLHMIAALFPPVILAISLITAIIGNLTFIYLAMYGLVKRRRYGFVPLMFLSPVYWVLQSIAAWKALYQLLVKPHYWEKTTHGLTIEATTRTPS